MASAAAGLFLSFLHPDCPKKALDMWRWIEYHNTSETERVVAFRLIRKGLIIMKKSTNSTGKIFALFGILFAIVAVIATATTALIYLDKKKDEEELERYLDDSIQ